jgi:type III pantothenate kinase
MRLLIDIGNSNTHIGIATSSEIISKHDIPNTHILPGNTICKLADLIPDNVKIAAICSVCPDVSEFITNYLKSKNVEVHVLKGENQTCLSIEYDNISSIGADRVSNCIALKHIYSYPSMAIGYGTAVTFDILDSSGKFIGGVIAPGIRMLTEALHHKTALLPYIKPEFLDKIIGQNTADAMLIGCTRSIVGLTKEVISIVKKELNAPDLCIVATGGYANIVARLVPEINFVDTKLTLAGLNIFLNSLKSNRLNS